MAIDYSEYPANWKEIRLRILEREGRACKHCGVGEYAVKCKASKSVVLTGAESLAAATALAVAYFKIEALPKILHKNYFTVVVLSIAHLDHDHTNHNVADDRLAALCAACHFKYDESHHRKNRKATEYNRRHKDQLTIF